MDNDKFKSYLSGKVVLETEGATIILNKNKSITIHDVDDKSTRVSVNVLMKALDKYFEGSEIHSAKMVQTHG